MLFGLYGTLAIFQRLIDNLLLLPHLEYTTLYFDDVVIYSGHWEDHLNQAVAVLRALREAGLTTTLPKCRIGWREMIYLRYTLGQGKVRPLIGKVQAIHPRQKKKYGTGGLLQAIHRRLCYHCHPLNWAAHKGQTPESVVDRRL